jgi:hypothetical protein
MSIPIRTASHSRPVPLSNCRNLVPHRECRAGDRLQVVWPSLGQPASHHIGVADRRDLLDALRIGEPVERGENLIKEGHELVRAMLNDRSVNPTRSAKSTPTASY